MRIPPVYVPGVGLVPYETWFPLYREIVGSSQAIDKMPTGNVQISEHLCHNGSNAPGTPGWHPQVERCTDANCLTGCVYYCNYQCGSRCEKECTLQCVNSCNTGCKNTCNDTCNKECVEACLNECKNGCFGKCLSCTSECSQQCGGNCIMGCSDLCDAQCSDNCDSGCKDTCNTGCYGGCLEGCFGCVGNCNIQCDNACQTAEMNNILDMLGSKEYGIVFTDDYMKLIAITLKLLEKRHMESSGTYQPYLENEKVNKATVIDFIIRNLLQLGYSNSETYGIINADQLKRLQVFIVNKAREVVDSYKGVDRVHMTTAYPPVIRDPYAIGNVSTFANRTWTSMHVFLGADKNRYAIIRLNDPIYRQYHGSDCGYWSESSLRAYFEGEFWNTIPASDQARIVAVSNRTSYATSVYAAGVQVTTDRVWLESYTNIIGTPWIGSNTGAVQCDECTVIAGVQFRRFFYYNKTGGQIGTGIMRRLRSTGGIAWNMACPATGTTINTQNHGDYFGTTAIGACYPCVCIRL